MAEEKNTIISVKSNSKTMEIMNDNHKSPDRKIAEIGLSASAQNAATTFIFSKSHLKNIEFIEICTVMDEKINEVCMGDLTGLEATLTAQTVSLDAIFHELADRAAANLSENLNASESYMRLALKAQAQCARTIEVIASMKNPPVIFAKQANIAHGHQQVNNVSNANPAHAQSRAEKTINQPNELLRNQNKNTIDQSELQRKKQEELLAMRNHQIVRD